MVLDVVALSAEVPCSLRASVPVDRHRRSQESDATRRRRTETNMNRELCKFFSGAFASMAYAHGAYAVATSSGVINEPVFLGRRWGVGYMWTEAAVYSAVSAGLGYLAWGGRTQDRQRKPT